MKKSRKIIYVIGFVLVAVFLFAAIRQCTVYYILPPDQDMAEQLYAYDQDAFELIIDYFVESGDVHIRIYDDSDMHIGGKKIEDKRVSDALKKLLTIKDYNMIGRNGDTVYFEKWSFGERSRGIAYSITGEETLLIDCLVKQEPLSRTGWYYYETEYD